jgi:hypothetical protein
VESYHAIHLLIQVSLDDYIKMFRNECQEHLGWEEAREFEVLFATRNPRMIFEELDLNISIYERMVGCIIVRPSCTREHSLP